MCNVSGYTYAVWREVGVCVCVVNMYVFGYVCMHVCVA